MNLTLLKLVVTTPQRYFSVTSIRTRVSCCNDRQPPPASIKNCSNWWKLVLLFPVSMSSLGPTVSPLSPEGVPWNLSFLSSRDDFSSQFKTFELTVFQFTRFQRVVWVKQSGNRNEICTLSCLMTDFKMIKKCREKSVIYYCAGTGTRSDLTCRWQENCMVLVACYCQTVV